MINSTQTVDQYGSERGKLSQKIIETLKKKRQTAGRRSNETDSPAAAAADSKPSVPHPKARFVTLGGPMRTAALGKQKLWNGRCGAGETPSGIRTRNRRFSGNMLAPSTNGSTKTFSLTGSISGRLILAATKTWWMLDSWVSDVPGKQKAWVRNPPGAGRSFDRNKMPL